MSRIWQIYAWVTISLAFFLMVVLAYWYFYPYKPLEITTQPMKVLTKEVKAGDLLHYEIDYCKYMNMPSEITRTIVDTVVYNMPTFTANNQTGCHSLIATAEIPDIAKGNYVYRVKFDYEVNPIRHVLIEAETEPFEVIK